MIDIKVKCQQTGKLKPLPYTQIGKKALIRRIDLLRYFNVAASTIDNEVMAGKLRKYLFNGRPKTGCGKEAVYYDLNEVLSIGENQPIVRKPRTIYIKKGRTAGESHATIRQPK